MSRNIHARAIAAAALLILPLSWIGGCESTPARAAPTGPPPAPARFNHIVFFSLNDAADADALVADSRRSLGAIPAVASLFCGRHVDAGRPGVMTDYDACVYVGFDSLDDYAAYVADPRHQDLVARWRDRLEGYRVYDVLNETAR